MPTAAASFDDFDMDEPARKKTPRTRASSGKGSARKRGGKKPPRFRFAFDGQKIARWGAIGMSGAVVVAILVNALVLQKGHHPAPLFGKSIALGPSPVPAPRSAPPVERAPVAAPEPVEPVPVAPPHARMAAAEPASGGDPIAALIAGHAPPAQASARSEGKTVLGAQKALAKLGFALKPSGTMGPQTRKAIEAFERDRHLPVKGELTHRVVKILAAESGIKID